MITYECIKDGNKVEVSNILGNDTNKRKKDKKNNKKILTENQEKQRIIHAILLIRLVSNIKFFKKNNKIIKNIS